MTFWKIFLLINAVGFLLTMASVRFRLSYEQELGLKISYLCFSYTVFPKKEKTKKQKLQRQVQNKKPRENMLKTVYQEKGLRGLLHLLRFLTEIAAGALQNVFRHMRVKTLSLHVAVAQADAAETAVVYGNVCAVIYPTFSALTGKMQCKRFEVAVVPDFQAAQTKIQGYADVKVRVSILLITAVQALFKYMKTAKSATINEENKKGKGGVANERQPSN
ncbi:MULTISPECIES: DUF2953 domain-containing protein [Caproicibacterium]|uniref:DUF2953 domain-containing protein n=1 Tax=Caproicibacterium argilliputei TaxID=3030016 RepID=A0AA97H163_9FIRM|nr:DUF2953 domain-containing protein [Caproicibacterium argilliputei]WOC31052.1 DUF2953 domain-containing protein [Caproicibacterium argilliputei]